MSEEQTITEVAERARLQAIEVFKKAGFPYVNGEVGARRMYLEGGSPLLLTFEFEVVVQRKDGNK